MFFDKRENILWASVIFIILLGVYIHENYNLFLLFWVISIVCVGNAKRIHSLHFEKITTIIRRSLYIFPYFAPILVLEFSTVIIYPRAFWIIVSILVGIMFVLVNYREWRLALNTDFIKMGLENSGQKVSAFYTLMNVYTLIFGAISEEFFFRLYTLTISNVLIINLILSMLSFTIAHYGTKWGDKFNKKDITTQIIFAFISSIMFILSNSIFPSIISHLIYNSPHVTLFMKKFIVSKRMNINGRDY